MSKPASFNGVSCYRVTEVSKVEHVRIKKNIFTGNVKTKTTQMENLESTVLIVSTSRERAAELYRERYNCKKVGDIVTGWDDLRRRDNCVVTSVEYVVKCPAVVTAKELYENGAIQDYVKFMTYLNKGFDELINPVFKYNEED